MQMSTMAVAQDTRRTRRLTHWLRGLGRVWRRPGRLTARDPQSGQTATASVRLFESDGERWLVAPYDNAEWVRYARASGEVMIRRGKVKETYAVEEVSADEAAPILKQYVIAARRPFVYLHARADAPLELFAAEAGRCPVFRLTAKNA